MRNIRKLALPILLLSVHAMHAQGESTPDFMRSIGKIYVVAAVCLIILLTLLLYMVLLDRKITKLEKRYKK